MNNLDDRQLLNMQGSGVEGFYGSTRSLECRGLGFGVEGLEFWASGATFIATGAPEAPFSEQRAWGFGVFGFGIWVRVLCLPLP